MLDIPYPLQYLRTDLKGQGG
ncbi:protein of unknown function [Magnetospirillum sp. XM-1]|nr:protein of unknown function [Magnetospirillum sp. XM-1]